jgi:Zn-dependent protease
MVTDASVISIQTCSRCGRDLPPGALACSFCHALVHAEELYRLTANATALEEKRDFQAARELWSNGLQLLPASAKQAEWIRDHLRELQTLESSPQDDHGSGHWLRKFGPIGAVLLLLLKGKSLLALFKLNFLVSLFAFVGFYWTLYGKAFGIGFALLILIHEMGHFIDVKRRGLPADMPVFLPGFGAYVRWQALGVSLPTRAAVSLAGPLAGLIASAACLAVWRVNGNALYAALAHASAWLNLLNLVPLWVLDGGQAVKALNKSNRVVLLIATIIIWALSRQNVLLLVAGGAVWQLFDKNPPAVPSRNTLVYFIVVLALLALVTMAVPAQFAPR